MSITLKSLGLGLSLETHTNFLRVSGICFKKVGLGEKSLSIGIEKFGLGKKVSVSVSKNLVSEKSLGIGIGKFGLGKKFSVSVSKIWYRKKSFGPDIGKFGLGIGLGKFGLG